MKKNYNFSKARKNPYSSKLKQQVTIRIDKETIAYFKRLSGDTGIAYQVLIDLFLRDCARNKMKPILNWKEA